MTESRARRSIASPARRRNGSLADSTIQTYFAVDGGHLDRVRRRLCVPARARLLNLRYIPAARLVHVNSQWRAQKTEGFPIGLMSGDWRSSMPEPGDASSGRVPAGQAVDLEPGRCALHRADPAARARSPKA